MNETLIDVAMVAAAVVTFLGSMIAFDYRSVRDGGQHCTGLPLLMAIALSFCLTLVWPLTWLVAVGWLVSKNVWRAIRWATDKMAARRG